MTSRAVYSIYVVLRVVTLYTTRMRHVLKDDDIDIACLGCYRLLVVHVG